MSGPLPCPSPCAAFFAIVPDPQPDKGHQMKDNVRDIAITVEDRDSVVEMNQALMKALSAFVTEHGDDIFIGSITTSKRRLMVRFEVVTDADPDTIASAYDPVSPSLYAGVGEGTGDEATASTDEPRNADEGSGPDDEGPGAATGGEPDHASGDPEHLFQLVDEDGEVLEQFDSEQAAWDAFENYPNANDVIEKKG